MGRVFASADWHGCGIPAEKLMSYLKEDDTLYFLGDAIDRGTDGLDIFKTLTTDPRVIYLRGNHEEFMLKAIQGKLEGITNRDFYIWTAGNGGNTTWADLELDTEENLIKYMEKIKQMPLKEEYISSKGHKVILEHAGYTVGNTYRFHDPLWDRNHFYDEWGTSEEDKNTYLIHGHTPVQYLQFECGYYGRPQFTKEEIAIKHSWYDLPTDYEWKPEVIRYCDGHKFDIDMCTICSGRVALIDLDTFEIIYFDTDKGE